MEDDKNKSPDAPFAVGDKVVTKFGEELEILEVKYIEPVTKKGQVLKEGKFLFLAQSGESKCWFSDTHFERKENK